MNHPRSFPTNSLSQQVSERCPARWHTLSGADIASALVVDRLSGSTEAK